jgi:hypothetical protein
MEQKPSANSNAPTIDRSQASRKGTPSAILAALNPPNFNQPARGNNFVLAIAVAHRYGDQS